MLKQDFDFIIKRTQARPQSKKADAKSDSLFHHAPPPSYARKMQLEDYHQISKLFYPLIFLSKWMGHCPVKILRRGKESTLRYEFRWISLPVISTLIFSGFTAVLLTTWILNSFYGINQPFRLFRKFEDEQNNWLEPSMFKGSGVVSLVNILIRISMPCGVFVCMILSWTDVQSLCQFFDEWPTFFNKFHRQFSPYYLPNFSRLKKCRNISCLIWFSPVVLLILTSTRINYLVTENPIWGYLFAYYQTFSVLGTRSISYVKDFMLMQTITTAYKEIGKGIKEEYRRYQRGITRDQVRGWVDLVTFVRKQTGRVESYMSCQNLWSIFEVFTTVLMLLSMTVFLMMNGVLIGGAGSNFIPFGLTFSVFFVCSLYWKTDIAEQITKAEEAIAEDILGMETDDDDCEARLEMKLILDLIYDDPVQVQIGNVFTLNKKLLLAYFSQLASYLVVILQFTKS